MARKLPTGLLERNGRITAVLGELTIFKRRDDMVNAFTRSCLFGGLFSDVEISDKFGTEHVWQQMLAFESAWTEALAETGAVSGKLADRALGVIRDAQLDAAMIASASAQDGLPVPSMIRLLKKQAGDEVAKAIHHGATSQDVMDTAMMLILRDVTRLMETRLTSIDTQLAQLDEDFGTIPLILRTRMQAALPGQCHDRLAAWRYGLAEARAHLVSLTFPVQVGGPVGRRDAPAGQGEMMARIVARKLGLELVPVWHGARGRVVDCGHVLVLITGALGKIGQDIALMAQQGIDEIRLSGGGGSSAMPHKQNPVRAETLAALARYVAGQQGTLAQCLVHEQERSGAAWSLEWLTLPAMVEATGASLNNATALLAGIRQMGRSD